VFPNGEVIATRPTELSGLQNMLLWGVKDKTWKFDAANPEIRNSKTTEIRDIAWHRVDLSRFDLAPHKIFTDDYAPVEFFAAKMTKQLRK